MNTPRSVLLACLALGLACSLQAMAGDPEQLRAQVKDTERAFAQTMADRDFEAFKSFLSAETIFFAGEKPMRGPEEVARAWAAFYDGADAPFSWAPETVEVLDSGALALSSGPVWNAEGKRVATFQSIWRQEQPGQWRIVFDKGSRYCEPAAPAAEE